MGKAYLGPKDYSTDSTWTPPSAPAIYIGSPAPEHIIQPRVEYVEVPTIIIQEKLIEVPVEKIIYVDKVIEKRVEVPVEKLVYQDRLVHVDRPVDRPIQVTVYEEKIVEVIKFKVPMWCWCLMGGEAALLLASFLV